MFWKINNIWVIYVQFLIMKSNIFSKKKDYEITKVKITGKSRIWEIL